MILVELNKSLEDVCYVNPNAIISIESLPNSKFGDCRSRIYFKDRYIDVTGTPKQVTSDIEIQLSNIRNHKET